MALSDIGHLAYDNQPRAGRAAGRIQGRLRIIISRVFSFVPYQKADYRNGYAHNSSNYYGAGGRTKERFPESNEENRTDKQCSQVREDMRFGFLHS